VSFHCPWTQSKLRGNVNRPGFTGDSIS